MKITALLSEKPAAHESGGWQASEFTRKKDHRISQRQSSFKQHSYPYLKAKGKTLSSYKTKSKEIQKFELNIYFSPTIEVSACMAIFRAEIRFQAALGF